MTGQIIEMKERDLFAAMILQAIIIGGDRSKHGIKGDIAMAVNAADELLKMLRSGNDIDWK
jgi:hypothetical protein